MDELIPASIVLFFMVLAAIAGLIVMAPGTRPYVNQQVLDETRRQLQNDHQPTGRRG